MSPRAAILVVAITLLGAGFAAFVRVAGDAGSAWGQRVSDASPGGKARQRRGGGEAPGAGAAWSTDADADASRAAAGRTATAGEGAARAARDAGGGGDGAGEVDPVEAEWSDRIGEEMRKLMRDLEYTKGLPEPPQQVVQPQPEPWRRDPSREGPRPEIAAVRPLRGRPAGGERVEIRGRNLRVVSVMFGTAPARLLQATDDVVAVEAPGGVPGPVTVVVTNDDGTWGAAAEPYVYGE